MFSLLGRKIYIAGHTGLVGSALVRHFSRMDSIQLVVAEHAELELTRQQAVDDFLSYHRPDIVIIAAGKVGGIVTNAQYPAEFIYQNLMIEANLIHASWRAGVKRLLNFGSACVYPKVCPQPMRPDWLMTGKIEETNEPYAVAKIAGLLLCEAYNCQYRTSYINAIPSNVYGPGDSFDLEKGHVVAAFIRKLHEAKKNGIERVVFWGSGNVKRDFFFVDDLAFACELLLKTYEGNKPINVGVQEPCSIRDLALKVAKVVGYEGIIEWDTSKPDGAPQRVLDATEIKKLGFVPQIDLETGLRKTYDWFLNQGVKN